MLQRIWKMQLGCRMWFWNCDLILTRPGKHVGGEVEVALVWGLQILFYGLFVWHLLLFDLTCFSKETFLTCPRGRWNLISFLNASSSILACWNHTHDNALRYWDRWLWMPRIWFVLGYTCPMLFPIGPCPISCPCSLSSGCIVIEVRSSVGARTLYKQRRCFTNIKFLKNIVKPWKFEMTFIPPVWTVPDGHHRARKGWWCCLVEPSLTNINDSILNLLKSCLQLLELVRVNHKRILFGSGARSVFKIKVLSSRNDCYVAVSASVIIWVPKSGESKSGQMVSEKVIWS